MVVPSAFIEQKSFKNVSTKKGIFNMNETQNKLCLSGLEFRIGITIVICLLVCKLCEMLGFSIQALAVCTGTVMCVQEGSEASFSACKNRVLGVICGGVVGVGTVLLDNLIGVELVFYLLVGLGIMANFVLCKAVKIPLVQARVSCMTLLLVVLVLDGPARLNYAIGRFVGTLVGALVALAVSASWEKLSKKEK
jgi:uncharacterized membrane protein YgaE (UPF0421/DUF939 family)